MWTSRLLLMWSIMPASVVVLPEPVGPVTSTRPRGSRASALEHRRQAEVVERDRADADPPEDQAGRAAGAEGVDPEPADAGQRVGEVGLVGAVRTPRRGPRAAPRATISSVSAGVRIAGLRACAGGRRCGPAAANPPCSAGRSRRTPPGRAGTARSSACRGHGDGHSAVQEAHLDRWSMPRIGVRAQPDDGDHVALLDDVALCDLELGDGARRPRRAPGSPSSSTRGSPGCRPGSTCRPRPRRLRRSRPSRRGLPRPPGGSVARTGWSSS